MREFDRAEPAIVEVGKRGRLIGDVFDPLDVRVVQVPTFEEAVRYFMLDLTPEQQGFARIKTGSGELWFLPQIQEIFDPPA
jgi:hypothetical protein